MSIKYQQGDVLLVALPKEEVRNNQARFNTRTHDGEEKKVILAEGEATGHHHRFEIQKLARGTSIVSYHDRSPYVGQRVSRFPHYILIKGGPATLYHEEHNPLTLPPGLYRRSIVREFDHISRSTRTVVD